MAERVTQKHLDNQIKRLNRNMNTLKGTTDIEYVETQSQTGGVMLLSSITHDDLTRRGTKRELYYIVNSMSRVLEMLK